MITNLLRVILSFFALNSFSATLAFGQEICNNGIDDDNDTFIDLLDTADCQCTGTLATFSPSSLLPNPSFEEFDCVPASFSELSCATIWEQATSATSDYFLNVPNGFWSAGIPEPIPDGHGLAGFIISKHLNQATSEFYIYNEYIGGCLISPLLAGIQYKIKFNLAAGAWCSALDSTGSTINFEPIDITLFGKPNCPAWPTTLPQSYHGCPEPYGNWSELGAVSYTANLTWQEVIIEFTPEIDIYSIMIGGPCIIPDGFQNQTIDGNIYNPYFWIDNLVLNEASMFSSISKSGEFCSNDLELFCFADSNIAAYQWYQEGIALVNQTSNSLQVSELDLPEGHYQLIAFLNDSTCAFSEISLTQSPIIYPIIETEPNTGCKPLNVQVINASGIPVIDSSWNFGDGETGTGEGAFHIYEESGVYDISLMVTLENGCSYDTTYSSFIEVFDLPVAVLTATPAASTVESPQITFAPMSNNDIVNWLWYFGDAAPSIDSIESPNVTFPSVPGSYPVELVVIDLNGCRDTVFMSIMIEKTGTTTLPNVFTPNGDGHNDIFKPLEDYPGDFRLTILNRWGNVLYTTESIRQGWNGENASEGTYYWVMDPREGEEGESRAGKVMLLRAE